MAKEIGYWFTFGNDQRAIIFDEGPFVVVFADGYRIECEHRYTQYTVLPDLSIYEYLRANRLSFDKSNSIEDVRKLCDFLNAAVKKNIIILHDIGYWYWSAYDARK